MTKTEYSTEIIDGAPWAFIAVMGVTGAGKSTFIQWASGSSDIVIGHDLESCTSEITAHTFHYAGYNISLVDTPGFNDTHKSETQILQDIACWLRETYEFNTRLNGIIYLHSLVNVRMEGSALRNLKMFRQLCGQEPLKNVILTTNFWSKVAREEALRREEQLKMKPEFWGDMLARGSTMKRLETRQDALDVVGLLVRKPKITLQIQHELVEDNKRLIDTAAGQAVSEELGRMAEEHKKELERVKQELQEALIERDHEMQQMLLQQEQRLDREFDKVRQQQEQLRYDRRAERRSFESEYEVRMAQLREEFERRTAQLTFDQAVALVRANEGKIPVSEREALERKIAELSKELSEKSDKEKPGDTAERKKKGSSRFLFKALQFILPMSTMILLGVPIPSPFGSGATASGFIEKLLGNGEADAQ